MVRALGISLVSGISIFLVVVALSARRPPGVTAVPGQLVGDPQTSLPDGILDGHRYSQDLGPVDDGLSEVALYVDGYSQRVSGLLQLRLLDRGQVLREASTHYRAPDDEVRFQFSPVADSSRGLLIAEVIAPGADQRTKVSLFVVERPGAGVPHLFHDGQDTGTSAPIRLRFGAPVSLSTQLLAISDRASQYHPGPLKTPVPLVTAALTLVLSGVLIAAVAGLGPRWLSG